MSTYPENTRAIFVTNVNGSGDDVMVFTSLTADVLAKAYTKATRKITYDEMYEVPERDTGFYLYEPCWLTVQEEARAQQLANNPTP